jgi:hypothetical protein
MPVRQAAAIWTVVFLIGLTGGELLRQQTLDDPALAVTRSRTEPTAAIPAAASGAAVQSATYKATTTTTPPRTTTMVECGGGPGRPRGNVNAYFRPRRSPSGRSPDVAKQATSVHA